MSEGSGTDWDAESEALVRPWKGSYDTGPPFDPASSVDTGASRFTGTGGIMVYGLTTFVGEEASDAPRYFSWDDLDRLIISGALSAGAFDNCKVNPLPGTWPAKYRDLKRV